MKPRLIILMVACLAMFCITLFNSVSVMTSGQRASAICVKQDQPNRRAGRRNRWRFTKHTFQYKTEDGQEHIAAIRFGAFWLNPEVGESVPVLYSPKTPESIYYDSVFHVWMLPAFFGTLFLMPAVRFIVRRRAESTGDST